MSDRLPAHRPPTIRNLPARTRRAAIGAAALIPALLIGALASTASAVPQDSGLIACAYPLASQDVPAAIRRLRTARTLTGSTRRDAAIMAMTIKVPASRPAGLQHRQLLALIAAGVALVLAVTAALIQSKRLPGTRHDYPPVLMKACKDDAQRAGERDRLLLEARRASKACRQRPDPAAPARRLASCCSVG
jgi:hypothetical protein